MIPAGHHATDWRGIAVLWGLSESQARRRKPWADPAHPPALTGDRPTGPKRPRLWDHDQAAAYASGTQIPELPDVKHPRDLLNAEEAAAELNMRTETLTRYRRMETARDKESGEVTLVAAHDKEVFGERYWYRSTVERSGSDRAARRGEPHGGRPPGRGRIDVDTGVREYLEEVAAQGKTADGKELAARLGISHSTALRRIREHESAT
ncbi:MULTISPECIES: hypothetical protein [unclassified Crossiella]|uniref:hypothetical protein n=1 Tax=unclassified Crossiella TaxID=2620835 RepID=UPI001FFF0FC1|nr:MULTISPECIES: hypothetical protein [unclassified Crossiella]MCK2237720.1 hypothetical protein [Crossiella sp. S99.2]MCK2255006.1 hypothetical protein [Crossiella sp. S99.1]